MSKQFKHIKLPMYRQGDFGYSCTTCKHIKSETEFFCTEYDVDIDPGYVCNAWKEQFSSPNNENV